jgi:hypothetical protein
MAAELLGLVLKHGPENNTLKVVMMTLTNYANEQDVCWPSIPTIAQNAALTDRTVYRALAKLCADGWIKKQNRFRKNGAKTSNAYRINAARLREFSRLHTAATKTKIDGFEPFEEESAIKIAPDTVSGTPDTQTGAAPDTESGKTLKKPNRKEGGAKMPADMQQAIRDYHNPATLRTEKQQIESWMKQRNALDYLA